MYFYLTNFQSIRPRFEKKQKELMKWLAKAHAKSFSHSSNEDKEEQFLLLLEKVGLGPGKIEKRGVHCSDFLQNNWDEMDIFCLNTSKQGAGLEKKMAFFQRAVEEIFSSFYLEKKLPENLIHVTCTGYCAPNGGQVLVSKRKEKTTITSAYHMGCYASLPAIRIASGFLGADIIHTEICSIHMNPGLHTLSEFVIESLFADGFIKYSLTQLKEDGEPSFKVLALLEEIIPDSLEDMSWTCHDTAFFMTLSKDIPGKIAKQLPLYLQNLLAKAELPDSYLQEAIFAIHPGGLKIIEQIASHLHLAPWQIAHSHDILKTCGNMSSATLPHVWEKILKDREVSANTLVISLAFGPGLTISGAIFQKEL